MGNCCTRETPDVGRPLLYEKLPGENGERKGIGEEKNTELETNENTAEASPTDPSNVE